MSFNFNPDNYENIGAISKVVPEGDYICAASKVEQKNDGLSFTFNILEGEHKNRKLFQNYNIYSNNEMYKELACRFLSTYCKAAGIGQVNQIQEFLNKPLRLSVVVKPATERYNKEHNKIISYSSISNSNQVTNASSETQEIKTNESNETKAPWEN